MLVYEVLRRPATRKFVRRSRLVGGHAGARMCILKAFLQLDGCRLERVAFE